MGLEIGCDARRIVAVSALNLFNHNLRKQRRDRRIPRRGDFLAVECATILSERLIDIGCSADPLALIDCEDTACLPQIFASTRNLERLDLTFNSAKGEFLVADVGSLPAIIAVMSLHWINDLPGLLKQCEIALQPGGLFMAAFVGGRSLHELRFALQQAELSVLGGATARVSPFLDVRDAAGLLSRASLREPVADLVTLNCTYATPLALMHDLRAMGETNALSSSAGLPLRREVLHEACRLYHDHYPAERGRVRATFEIVCLTGWAG